MKASTLLTAALAPIFASARFVCDQTAANPHGSHAHRSLQGDYTLPTNKNRVVFCEKDHHHHCQENFNLIIKLEDPSGGYLEADPDSVIAGYTGSSLRSVKGANGPKMLQYKWDGSDYDEFDIGFAYMKGPSAGSQDKAKITYSSTCGGNDDEFHGSYFIKL